MAMNTLGALVTLVVALVAIWLVGLLAARLPDGAFNRRTVRFNTLRGVLTGVLQVAIVAMTLITLLAQFGINIAALLAGVSVVGLAVSFGAQSLVKDVLTGFFILLEDQYGIGDVIRIGPANLSGSVERLSLRVTVLRDLDGTVHVVPNGQIQTVSVLSKEWSRAVADITVTHTAPLTEAIKELERVALELYKDELWHAKFLEAPQVLGVQALGPNGVRLRVLMKVLPKEQWVVAREFYRRAKLAFDASGIAMADS